jgi:hypothetical protein
MRKPAVAGKQIWRLQTGQPQRVLPRITCMEMSKLSIAKTVVGADASGLLNGTKGCLFCGYFKNV